MQNKPDPDKAQSLPRGFANSARIQKSISSSVIANSAHGAETLLAFLEYERPNPRAGEDWRRHKDGVWVKGDFHPILCETGDKLLLQRGLSTWRVFPRRKAPPNCLFFAALMTWTCPSRHLDDICTEKGKSPFPLLPPEPLGHWNPFQAPRF